MHLFFLCALPAAAIVFSLTISHVCNHPFRPQQTTIYCYSRLSPSGEKPWSLTLFDLLAYGNWEYTNGGHWFLRVLHWHLAAGGICQQVATTFAQGAILEGICHVGGANCSP